MRAPLRYSACFALFILAACASSPPPSATSAPPPAAPVAASHSGEAPAASPAESADAPEVAASTDGMVTVQGKSAPITQYKLTQEGDEFYFYADTEADEGIGIILGKELKAGALIERDRGVTGHIRVDGKPLNVGDSSSFSLEITTLELGTWQNPGKCSGRFRAEVKTATDTIKASGAFNDIPCYSM